MSFSCQACGKQARTCPHGELLDQASSLRLWLEAAHSSSPEESEYRVPHRFVVWEEPLEELEEPLHFNQEALRIRRVLARFFGDGGAK